MTTAQFKTQGREWLIWFVKKEWRLQKRVNPQRNYTYKSVQRTETAWGKKLRIIEEFEAFSNSVVLLAFCIKCIIM